MWYVTAVCLNEVNLYLQIKRNYHYVIIIPHQCRRNHHPHNTRLHSYRILSHVYTQRLQTGKRITLKTSSSVEVRGQLHSSSRFYWQR